MTYFYFASYAPAEGEQKSSSDPPADGMWEPLVDEHRLGRDALKIQERNLAEDVAGRGK